MSHIRPAQLGRPFSFITMQRFPHFFFLRQSAFTWLIVFYCSFSSLVYGESAPYWLEAIVAAKHIAPNFDDSPIIIAVVDDGVRVTHQDLQGLIWTNTGEIPNNHIDDDGNGFVDDIHGWDVSDEDGDISPPQGSEAFHHGTHIAGIIASIARKAYGQQAEKHIQIMPVKSLSDALETTYLNEAYQGIEYAINAGADIILCAWSMSTLSDTQSRLLQRAAEHGILVVGAAGNFPQDQAQYPAAHQAVVAVAALAKDGSKLHNATYGSFVDLAAPGEAILSLGVTSDTAVKINDGSSAASAMVAAAAGLIKSQHPQYLANELRACLLSSVTPHTHLSQKMRARFGAGRLNVAAAVDCAGLRGTTGEQVLANAKGVLRPSLTHSKSVTWQVQVEGYVKGLRFSPVFSRIDQAAGHIEVRQSTSVEGRLVSRFAVNELMGKEIYVPGSSATISYQPGESGALADWLMTYQAETIDVSTLYCRGTKKLFVEGSLTDGSGEAPYAYHSDCKWLITAPKGKEVLLELTQLDTEKRTDMIYVFNGKSTNADVMAIYSGNKLPPVLRSWTNQVLVWFVTDGQNERQGWEMDYRFVDPQSLH